MPESRKRPVEFTKLTYGSLRVGDEFVSDDHLVIPEDVETHGFAVEDDHPWLAEGQAPPTLMASQALHLHHSKYTVHAGLHAKSEGNINALRVLAPLPRTPSPGHHAPGPAPRPPLEPAGSRR